MQTFAFRPIAFPLSPSLSASDDNRLNLSDPREGVAHLCSDRECLRAGPLQKEWEGRFFCEKLILLFANP